jgi:hypothetical protein
MAASQRVKTGGWSVKEQLTSAQMTTVDITAAAGVRRDSTTGGARSVPCVFLGTLGGAASAIVSPGSNLTWGFRATGSAGAAGTAGFALLDLPHGHTLNSISVKFFAATSHTILPTTKPRVVLYRKAWNLSTATVLATATFAGNTAAFKATAGFTLTATGVAASVATINLASYAYFVTVRGESGSGSKASLLMAGLQANVTVDVASGGVDFTFWK